jgi:FtsZ-interacting cell division protein ZipA
MSDLQISLLIIGAVVVVAVYLFNKLQEHKLRRRMEQVFAQQHDDVLLDAPPPDPGIRIEPQFQPAHDIGSASSPELLPESPRTPDTAKIVTTDAIPDPPDFDPLIDCIAQIDANALIPDAVIDELLGRIAVVGKPVRAAGFNAASGQWEDLGSGRGSRYVTLRFALQLVNRSGPAQASQIATFCDVIKQGAERMAAVASLPNAKQALETARKLDEFCADVDVAIGINIIADGKGGFPAARIRLLTENAGFKLEPEGIFHFRNDQRRTLFTLDNHEPAPFIPEQIGSLSTKGITLLLDVPRVADGQQAFDRMIEIGGKLAQELGGKLVDDNRVVLNPPGIAKIRQQLGAIQGKMDAYGIHAGSTRALRLFS